MSTPNDDPARRQRLRPETEAEIAARTAREAAALRANLRRRKQQQRARAAAAPDPATPDHAAKEPPCP